MDHYRRPPDAWSDLGKVMTFKPFLKAMSHKILYQKNRLQEWDTSVCGCYCVYFLAFFSDKLQGRKCISVDDLRLMLDEMRRPFTDDYYGNDCRISNEIHKTLGFPNQLKSKTTVRRHGCLSSVQLGSYFRVMDKSCIGEGC